MPHPSFYAEGTTPRSEDSEQKVLTKILGALLNGGGGTFVDATSYAPQGTVGQASGLAIDSASGALLVLDRAKNLLIDSIRAHVPEPTPDAYALIRSTSTTYVAGASIDTDGYTRLSILPRITANAGTAIFLKFQWSHDLVNWFENYLTYTTTVDSPAVGETKRAIITTANAKIEVYEIPSAATGYKDQVLVPVMKARYFRFLQKSDAAVTVDCEYHYQLL